MFHVFLQAQSFHRIHGVYVLQVFEPQRISAGNIIIVFRPGTDIISLLILFFFSCSSCWGDRLLNSLTLRRFKSETGWNLAELFFADWRSRISDMTSYFSRWRPWRHFTQKSVVNGEQQRFVSSWSLIHLYLFVNYKKYNCYNILIKIAQNALG